MGTLQAVLVGLLAVVVAVSSGADDSTYLIGAGRYDVTGPAAEIEMVKLSKNE